MITPMLVFESETRMTCRVYGAGLIGRWCRQMVARLNGGTSDGR